MVVSITVLGQLSTGEGRREGEREGRREEGRDGRGRWDEGGMREGGGEERMSSYVEKEAGRQTVNLRKLPLPHITKPHPLILSGWHSTTNIHLAPPLVHQV